MVKVIAWNIAHRAEAWRFLLDTDADIALLQEAAEPPADVAKMLEVDSAPWWTPGIGKRPWRTAVVKLSDRVRVNWLEAKPLHEAHSGELAVSRPGSLAAATVAPNPKSGESFEPFIVASMYAMWGRPHTVTGSGWIYADGSVHRIISDLSAFIGQQKGHRILAAGDLNILNGYGEYGSAYWASRYATVFSRMSMSSDAELFTIEQERWYAWQMLPGYGSQGHYYSSVRISRIEPKKRGNGTLWLEFYNAGYAAGVRNFELELRVLLRAQAYMIAAIGEGETHADTRCAIISPVDMKWLDRHFPEFMCRYPPTESERHSRDANGFLDRLMGTGDI